MAAPLEEVVVDADHLQTQQLFPEPGDGLPYLCRGSKVSRSMPEVVFGSGNALRSTFPLAVNGRPSIRMKSVGTMYAGSRSAR